MLKADLVAECEKRNLDSSGVKSELIERLESNDKSAKASTDKVKENRPKQRRFNPMLHRWE